MSYVFVFLHKLLHSNAKMNALNLKIILTISTFIKNSTLIKIKTICYFVWNNKSWQRSNASMKTYNTGFVKAIVCLDTVIPLCLVVQQLCLVVHNRFKQLFSFEPAVRSSQVVNTILTPNCLYTNCQTTDCNSFSIRK